MEDAISLIENAFDVNDDEYDGSCPNITDEFKQLFEKFKQFSDKVHFLHNEKNSIEKKIK